MTAYGAMSSLMNTINNILHCSRYRLIGSSEQIIQIVSRALRPWQGILERLDETRPSRSRKKVNALDGRIKEAIWKFEDSLESLLPQYIHSRLETIPERVFIDLQSLRYEFHSFIETLRGMEKDYVYEVENMTQDEPISTSIGFHGLNSKMIGLSDQFHELKTNLMHRSCDLVHLHSIFGTAGVGKTTLAMQIYQDPQIHTKFKCRAWVTVGRVPQPNSQILRGILAQLCGITQGDEEIDNYSLKDRLHGMNCLIVLDDVWDDDAWKCLNDFYEDIQNACVYVLVTGRHRSLINIYMLGFEVRFLNEEESMELLCEKVFGDEICPPHLHKAAVKIAKYCEGLPLLIVTVASILLISEQNRDPTYWNEVAERRNSVFTDAYDEISKVLFPSYDYLPQRLKLPFLFMGVFPRDYDTHSFKIIIMLMTEGLLSRYDWGCGYLLDLHYKYNLVLCNLKSVNKSDFLYFIREFKTCWLHSSWRHVCRGEASKNKFYHVLNKLTDAEEEVLKGQRGLCVENSILFGIKDFRDSVSLNCASFARSLLFYGPYHQYPVSIDVGFMLLREIDVLTQRFYTFPIEILTLVQLKYLALTSNGEVPSTISKLVNLRVLIIHPHMKIRRRGAPSYVPIQVWDMKELEHIEILGKSLVAPSHVVSLKKLSTLVGVNASICTIFKLSKRIPNIKKLGIQIELTPYDDHNDILGCFGCISILSSLRTLKLSITNPVIKNGHVFPVTYVPLKLPHYLEKLHLSGTGFPWEYMDAIGSLPYLEVLKLRSYAFQGSHWETKMYSFRRLKFLLIEETDLVQLKLGYRNFRELKYLSMKHCYKLEDIGRPISLDKFKDGVIEIELEDCNPLAFTSASQLQPKFHVMLRVIASSSFYEKPTTFKCERYTSDVEDTEEHTSDDEDMDTKEYALDSEDVEEDNNGECTFDYEGTGELGAYLDIDDEYHEILRRLRILTKYTRSITKIHRRVPMSGSMRTL